MLEKNSVAEEEKALLIALCQAEDLAEKKTKIYSRLLTDATLAKEMEELSFRHEQRKERLMALVNGKAVKKKNGQGRYEMNQTEDEK